MGVSFARNGFVCAVCVILVISSVARADEPVLINLLPQSAGCIDPEIPPENIQCPGDGDFEAIDELVRDSYPGIWGISCAFDQLCTLRVESGEDLPTRVCQGDGVGEGTEVDVEIVTLNSGAATAVPVFVSVLPGGNGKGLDMLDTVNCFRITECNCVANGFGAFECEKGDVFIYYLARYEINHSIACTRPIFED